MPKFPYGVSLELPKLHHCPQWCPLNRKTSKGRNVYGKFQNLDASRSPRYVDASQIHQYQFPQVSAVPQAVPCPITSFHQERQNSVGEVSRDLTDRVQIDPSNRNVAPYKCTDWAKYERA
ncbi:MAG: hypothetical protein RMX35_10585 [Nostoc sp. DcaGUA01]|nr:hypothetical protein [Nostoc sp. DcaGUA01]